MLSFSWLLDTIGRLIQLVLLLLLLSFLFSGLINRWVSSFITIRKKIAAIWGSATYHGSSIFQKVKLYAGMDVKVFFQGMRRLEKKLSRSLILLFRVEDYQESSYLVFLLSTILFISLLIWPANKQNITIAMFSNLFKISYFAFLIWHSIDLVVADTIKQGDGIDNILTLGQVISILLPFYLIPLITLVFISNIGIHHTIVYFAGFAAWLFPSRKALKVLIRYFEQGDLSVIPIAGAVVFFLISVSLFITVGVIDSIFISNFDNSWVRLHDSRLLFGLIKNFGHYGYNGAKIMLQFPDYVSSSSGMPLLGRLCVFLLSWFLSLTVTAYYVSYAVSLNIKKQAEPLEYQILFMKKYSSPFFVKFWRFIKYKWIKARAL